MKTIRIIEPGHTGHVLFFVRILAMRGLDLGHQVNLTLREGTQNTQEFRVHIAELNGRCLIDFQPESYFRSRAILNDRADAIIIPHADIFLKMLVRRRNSSGDVRALIMRNPDWERPTDWRRRITKLAKQVAIKIAGSRSSTKLFMLREPGYAPESPDELYIEDPVVISTTRPELRQWSVGIRQDLGLKPEISWVGIVGAIQVRKNPLLVAKAIARLRESGRSVGLAVIGPWPPGSIALRAEVERYCSDQAVPLVLDDRVLTNEEMNASIMSVDVVAMAYSSHSPNSTLGKCAALGIPIAAAGSQSIRNFVEALGMGPVVDLQIEPYAVLLSSKLDASTPAPQQLLGPEKMAIKLIPEELGHI